MVVLHGDYLAIAEAENVEAFRATVLRFTRRLGFNTVSAIVLLDRPDGGVETVSVDNTPAGYAPVFNDKGRAHRCPVMQHCKHHSSPIVWDRVTFEKAGETAQWETQAQHGYDTGICLAVHLPGGRHFALGVDRDQALPTSLVEVMRLVADAQLFAACAVESAIGLLAGRASCAHMPSLTPRELETLKWTIDGKTAREVGERLGIAERTVNMHSRHAIKKLGCASKYQAAIKALRLGLIR
jgi:DNA-binding CsgD family transcriptional regulator